MHKIGCLETTADTLSKRRNQDLKYIIYDKIFDPWEVLKKDDKSNVRNIE